MTLGKKVSPPLPGCNFQNGNILVSRFFVKSAYFSARWSFSSFCYNFPKSNIIWHHIFAFNQRFNECFLLESFNLSFFYRHLQYHIRCLHKIIYRYGYWHFLRLKFVSKWPLLFPYTNLISPLPYMINVLHFQKNVLKLNFFPKIWSSSIWSVPILTYQ